MNPGDTVRDLDQDPDPRRRHLSIVVSAPTAEGQVAVVNVTTHDLDRVACSNDCTLINRGEHPFVRHRSCIRYDRAHLRRDDLLTKSVDTGIFRSHEPLSDELLARVQAGLLASPRTPLDVKDAISETR